MAELIDREFDHILEVQHEFSKFFHGSSVLWHGAISSLPSLSEETQKHSRSRINTNSHTLKMHVTQHDFDRLYFYYLGFLFRSSGQIIPTESGCIISTFPLITLLLGLFHWGSRAGWVNWGQYQKIKYAMRKIDRKIVWKWRFALLITFVADHILEQWVPKLPITAPKFRMSFGVMKPKRASEYAVQYQH